MERENTSIKVQVLAIINVKVPQQIVLTRAEKTTADERKLMQKCYEKAVKSKVQNSKQDDILTQITQTCPKIMWDFTET